MPPAEILDDRVIFHDLQDTNPETGEEVYSDHVVLYKAIFEYHYYKPSYNYSTKVCAVRGKLLWDEQVDEFVSAFNAWLAR